MAPAPPPDDQSPPAAPRAVVLMGVAGSGKTTVGSRLAERLGMPFRDADEFHPPANVAKMASGTPLTDDDRWPWLDAIGAAIHKADDGIVVTCSALKRAYRERIKLAGGRPVQFVYLDVSRESLIERLAARKGHFFPPNLLDSQLATLERPTPDEGAIVVAADGPVDAVADAVLVALAARGFAASPA